MKRENTKGLNTEALAYMGDAVYEKFIREKLLAGGMARVNNLHRVATGYVRAGAQAEAIRLMFEELSEEEQRLVKRARNHKFNSKAKNVDSITYKWATAFETLVGYLYLADKEERLTEVMNRAVEIIEGEGECQTKAKRKKQETNQRAG